MAQPLLSRLKQSGATSMCSRPNGSRPSCAACPRWTRSSPRPSGTARCSSASAGGSAAASAPRLRGGVRAAEQLEVGASFRSSPHPSASATRRAALWAAQFAPSEQRIFHGAITHGSPAGRTPLGRPAAERLGRRNPRDVPPLRNRRIHGALSGRRVRPAKRWPYFRSSPRGSVRQRCSAPERRTSRCRHSGKNLIGKTSLDEAIRLIAGAPRW